jgi:uncharacterized phiE125 gp8 family phage protein
MPLTLITAPQVEPLSLDEAKQQVQQTSNVDDALIRSIWIPAVRERGEIATRRAFIRQVWSLVLDAFPACDWIEIPKPPLITVDAFTYLDADGVTQTLVAGTDYVVTAPMGPRCARGRVALMPGKSWPVAQARIGAVQIQFTCGYGAVSSSVPSALKAAMLLDLGRLYANREEAVLSNWSAVELPGGAKATYLSYRSHSRQGVAA